MNETFSPFLDQIVKYEAAREGRLTLESKMEQRVLRTGGSAALE